MQKLSRKSNAALFLEYVVYQQPAFTSLFFTKKYSSLVLNRRQKTFAFVQGVDIFTF